MNHRQAFIDTQTLYGVGPTALHKQTGIARAHISNFVNCKGDLTTEKLSKLVDGMEQLAPGAKKYYCQILLGKKFANYEQLAEEASREETAAFLKTISERIGTGLISSPELVS